jgi:hypothetical protein
MNTLQIVRAAIAYSAHSPILITPAKELIT